METEYVSTRYLPFGDIAFLVEFGEAISLEANRKVVALNEAILNSKLPEVEELIPTYRSLLVRYDPLKTTYEQLVFPIRELESQSNDSARDAESRKVTIPVVYGGEYGPDIGHVAKSHGLTEEQVAKLHSGRDYRVYMLGFVAGFPYLGEVSDEIATPRLETPRLKVPTGSVGIAERQTGVYPVEAPGGWQIIGRTPLKLFDPQQQPPALLSSGDLVRFKPISERELKTLEKIRSTNEHRSSSQTITKGLEVFRVSKPGMFTTVQDLGRRGYLKYGVPISGAMDTFSLAAANQLVGNNVDDACLETTLIGPELQALANTQIAITGGEVSLKINDKIVAMWQTLEIRKGDVVSFGKMESGCRSYLSIRGGMNFPMVLGSRSTFVRGGFGGIEGRQLKMGDVISGFEVPPLEIERSTPEELRPVFTGIYRVHVVLGPQADMFTDEGINTFLSNPYNVTLESDRMGYRLEGSGLKHKGRADIVSDALLPGAVQVPKNGKPIIAMRDAQTTGGYAKIAVVITPDVSLLGQAKPNDTIEFFKMTVQQAHQKVREYLALSSRLNASFNIN